ncbi:MAG: hypothetical protein ACJ76F_12850 [Bacteroidia bacterium]
MTIKIADFICLSPYDKARCIWKSGELIGGRSVSGYSILLYSLSGFYVEVFYAPADQQIKKIELLSDEAILSDYAEQVNIKDLFRI